MLKKMMIFFVLTAPALSASVVGKYIAKEEVKTFRETIEALADKYGISFILLLIGILIWFLSLRKILTNLSTKIVELETEIKVLKELSDNSWKTVVDVLHKNVEKMKVFSSSIEASSNVLSTSWKLMEDSNGDIENKIDKFLEDLKKDFSELKNCSKDSNEKGTNVIEEVHNKSAKALDDVTELVKSIKDAIYNSKEVSIGEFLSLLQLFPELYKHVLLVKLTELVESENKITENLMLRKVDGTIKDNFYNLNSIIKNINFDKEIKEKIIERNKKTREILIEKIVFEIELSYSEKSQIKELKILIETTLTEETNLLISDITKIIQN